MLSITRLPALLERVFYFNAQSQLDCHSGLNRPSSAVKRVYLLWPLGMCASSSWMVNSREIQGSRSRSQCSSRVDIAFQRRSNWSRQDGRFACEADRLAESVVGLATPFTRDHACSFWMVCVASPCSDCGAKSGLCPVQRCSN